MRKFHLIKNELKNSFPACLSLLFLLVIIMMSIFAFVSPFDPDEVNISNIMEKPSLVHLFGTDELGRDYFTRALFGGRISLLIGIMAMILSTSIGILIGTISGYFGGKIDSVLMRLVDIISSIPWMILVTVVSIFLTPGLSSIILVIGLFTWMNTARLIRAETLTIKEREFVLYAKASGQSKFAIIRKHISRCVTDVYCSRNDEYCECNYDGVSLELFRTWCSAACLLMGEYAANGPRKSWKCTAYRDSSGSVHCSDRVFV